MSVDITKVQFATPAYTIDKIATYADGQGNSWPSGTPINLHYDIPGSGIPDTPTYTLQSIPNLYTKRLLTTLSWSLDNVNYYDQGVPVFYYNATDMLFGTQMQIFCGCSDSTIYFQFVSSFTATQTVYLQFALDSPT